MDYVRVRKNALIRVKEMIDTVSRKTAETFAG